MLKVLALLLLLAVPDLDGSWRLDNVVQDGQLTRDPRWSFDLVLEDGRFHAVSVVQGEKRLTDTEGQPQVRAWREETRLQGDYVMTGDRLLLQQRGEVSDLLETSYLVRWDGDRLVLEGKRRTLYFRRWRL